MTTPVAPRALLAVAAIAIGFAAADTYVVVMALPEMMTASGLAVDELQKAAPIVSGFLLGYVAVLPLIGRISDIHGRIPVLLASLAIFAVGSLITAAAYDLNSIVAGRVIQGIGGGGLIPPTLALVADIWPAERRGLPLGVVGAVQELGSVLGPIYGAVVLAFGDWRAIFWLNAAVGVVLAAAVLTTTFGEKQPTIRLKVGRFSTKVVVALLALVGLLLVLMEPDALARDITLGHAFLPVVGDSRWLTPLALGTYALGAPSSTETDWRTWRAVLREVDIPGAALLTVALGAVILTFASADPEKSVISPHAEWLLPVAVVATLGFTWRQRSAETPLLPRGAVASRPAWGALVVSFFVGAALIAALVDIPFFARLTVHPDSQLDAALVLLRFLVAVPVGAVLGGWALRRVPASLITAVAMALSAIAFWRMAQWGPDSLTHELETITLVIAGLGFGLALAPVNAALLAHTRSAVHGVASALLVVARMVGMLLGISALTAVGLRAFQSAVDDIPPIQELCGGLGSCEAYRQALLGAALDQLSAVFTGAAVCSVIAATLALVLLRDETATRRR